MMNWLLNFVAGMAFISLAGVGFVIIAVLFLRWLSNNTTYSFEALSISPEREVDALRDEAIGDMFDMARAARMQRATTESGDSNG